jgi:hypothetical protein
MILVPTRSHAIRAGLAIPPGREPWVCEPRKHKYVENQTSLGDSELDDLSRPPTLTSKTKLRSSHAAQWCGSLPGSQVHVGLQVKCRRMRVSAIT